LGGKHIRELKGGKWEKKGDGCKAGWGFLSERKAVELKRKRRGLRMEGKRKKGALLGKQPVLDAGKCRGKEI